MFCMHRKLKTIYYYLSSFIEFYLVWVITRLETPITYLFLTWLEALICLFWLGQIYGLFTLTEGSNMVSCSHFHQASIQFQAVSCRTCPEPGNGSPLCDLGSQLVQGCRLNLLLQSPDPLSLDFEDQEMLWSLP